MHVLEHPAEIIDRGKPDGVQGGDTRKTEEIDVQENDVPAESQEISLHVPYVAAIQVLHVWGDTFHVYVGYGNGTVAVFDLKTAELLRRGDVPGREPVVVIELATQLGAVLIISGSRALTMWNCKDLTLLRT